MGSWRGHVKDRGTSTASSTYKQVHELKQSVVLDDLEGLIVRVDVDAFQERHACGAPAGTLRAHCTMSSLLDRSDPRFLPKTAMKPSTSSAQIVSQPSHAKAVMAARTRHAVKL